MLLIIFLCRFRLFSPLFCRFKFRRSDGRTDGKILSQRCGRFQKSSFISNALVISRQQCLNLLELLQYEGFRTEIINTPCAKFIEDQLLLHWQHYPRKRLKLLEQHAAQETVTLAPTPSPAPETNQTPGGSVLGTVGGSTPGSSEGGGGGAPLLQSAVMQSKTL